MDRETISFWEEDYKEWLTSNPPIIPNYTFWSGRMAMCIERMGENPTIQSVNYWMPILWYCTEKYNGLIYERNNLK